MSAAIPPLPQYTFMVWCSVKKSTRATLSLPYQPYGEKSVNKRTIRIIIDH
jgi:hypothetical protein